MFISLQELETKTVRFEVDLPPGKIEFDSKIKQATDLKAKGSARLLNRTLGEIRVEGDVAVEVEGTCDRCLDRAQYAISNQFDLVYMPGGESSSRKEDEIEKDALDVGFYEGDGLELNDVLREVILLALPMQLICGEDCRGICPVCGQNRNQQDCGCSPASTDDRWNKLRMLRAEIAPRD
jgi:uncharacterized protein